MSRAAAVQQAYVLHQWAWSETSLILDLFTREQGRVAAVAKGAKRPYSQLRPVLMPFQRLHVVFNKTKGAAEGDILTLRSAEYAGAGARLPGPRLIAGFYLNELLMKLLARGDAHERLFDIYGQTLQALAAAQAESDEPPALRAFELRLLRENGVLPELDRDTTTQAALQPGRGYQLLAEGGLVPAAAASGSAAESRLSAELCLALERGLAQDDGATLRTACRAAPAALRLQLRALLAYHLGAPTLRSRELMLEVRRLIEPAAALDRRDGASSAPTAQAAPTHTASSPLHPDQALP